MEQQDFLGFGAIRKVLPEMAGVGWRRVEVAAGERSSFGAIEMALLHR
jgi:hypothetical protein